MVALPFAKTALEIVGVTADEQRRIPLRSVQQRCDEARGGRLAVGSGNHHRVLARDRESIEGVRKRQIRQALVDRGPRLGVVRPDCIPDHDQIRARVEHVLRPETRMHRDSPLFEHRAHRRVEGVVRARDSDSAGGEKSRQRSHPGAADRDEVNVPRCLVHATRPRRLR